MRYVFEGVYCGSWASLIQEIQKDIDCVIEDQMKECLNIKNKESKDAQRLIDSITCWEMEKRNYAALPENAKGYHEIASYCQDRGYTEFLCLKDAEDLMNNETDPKENKASPKDSLILNGEPASWEDLKARLAETAICHAVLYLKSPKDYRNIFPDAAAETAGRVLGATAEQISRSIIMDHLQTAGKVLCRSEETPENIALMKKAWKQAGFSLQIKREAE